MASERGGVEQSGGALRNLDDLRGQIDQIDDALLALIEQRLSRSKAIAELKRSADRSTLLLRPDRERELLERLKRSSESLPPFVVEAIWREIMACSLQLQQVTELAIHAGARPMEVVNLARLRLGCAAPIHVATTPLEALERARLSPSIAVIELNPTSDWWVPLAQAGDIAIFDWLVDEHGTAVGLLVGRCDESCRLPDLSFPILGAAALEQRIAADEPIRQLAASGELCLAVSTAQHSGRIADR